MTFPTISLRQLDEWIRQGQKMQLVDLRDSASYEMCHIDGAVNIPMAELEERKEEISKDIPVVFYCSRGGQSMLACSNLGRQGYRVINVANGICCYRGRYRTNS